MTIIGQSLVQTVLVYGMALLTDVTSMKTPVMAICKVRSMSYGLSMVLTIRIAGSLGTRFLPVGEVSCETRRLPFSTCSFPVDSTVIFFYVDMDLEGPDVMKLIEHNKLRLQYSRRPCVEDGCSEYMPAFADFPNGWGGRADVLHVDFKAPSEHWINGIAYDAEMQIFHGHRGRKRLPTAGVVIKALPDMHNPQLQRVLDEFQAVFNQHADECEASRRRDRRKLAQAHKLLKGNSLWESVVDYASSWKYSLWSESPQAINATESHRRLRANWFPYHPLLTPSPWFYAYAGSLTEPPCTEFVNWRIIRRPMLISMEQLEQLKHLLMNHVDSTCKRTSVHHARSVARPVQATNGRLVVRCSSRNWAPHYGLFPPNLGVDSYDESLPLI